jgi:hypothetical protein
MVTAESVVQELRSMQGFGLITPAHCARAERYAQRHPEVFERQIMTLHEAADIAVDLS